MKVPPVATRRLMGVLLSSIALATVVSCNEAPIAPAPVRQDAGANSQLLDGLLGGTVETLSKTIGGLNLLSCKDQKYDSVTQVVGSAGGTINVGDHKLVIPSGALGSNVTITAVAPVVPRREVRFQPEGLKFKEDAKLTLSYKGCSLVSQLLPKKIVYVDDGLNILELLLSLDSPLSQKVTGKLEHFSGYVVAF